MNSKLKKALIITAVTGCIIVTAAILFISPFTKYLIEKYDEKYVGRKIEVNRAYINLFSGYIYLSGFKLYEFKSDSIFFSTKELGINISLLKLLTKTYEISELTLTEPKGIIVQGKKVFNFDDLIKKFFPKKTDSTKDPLRFNILNIKIKNGEFHYREKVIPVNYFIKNVNIESSGIRWDVDTVSASFSFLSGPGKGEIKGNSTINVKNLDYCLAVVANKFDLSVLEQYIKAMSMYGSFTANMDADIKATGNLNDKENVSAKGVLTINDLHFGKNSQDDYTSLEKLIVSIKELSPQKYIYQFDSVSVKHFYFKYERYDHLDNLQNMFGRNGANITAANEDSEKFNLVIEIAKYVEVLVKKFFSSDYKINRIAIYDANLQFNDFSISERFSMALNPLSLHADSISKSKHRIAVLCRSGIKPYGNISVNLSINPKDSSDFKMQYHLDKLPCTLFNPYIISYTSFALNRGTMEFKGSWNVKKGNIESNNHLLLIDPRSTKRIRNKDTKWIPLPLIMSFVRERGNVIDYEIPIKGNLKDPEFHLHDVIVDVLKNIFIKPPTTPYRLQVQTIETEIEKFLTLNWGMREASPSKKEEEFINKMVDFLADNPEASIDVYPNQYALKEKEHILFFEAKKKYFLLMNNKSPAAFNENDSLDVDKMSVKNTPFVLYLDKVLNDSMLFTIQAKCDRFIGGNVINSKFSQLNKAREEAFIFYFKEKDVDKRVKMHIGENNIPYNGFSFYKINYKDDFPKSLIDAHQKMDELDEEAPRKQYKKERRKYKDPS